MQDGLDEDRTAFTVADASASKDQKTRSTHGRHVTYSRAPPFESRIPIVHAAPSKHWPWMVTLGGAAVVCLAITAAATAAAAGAAPPGGSAQAGSAISTNQQEAVASYNALQQNFYFARQSLYAAGLPRAAPIRACGRSPTPIAGTVVPVRRHERCSLRL